MAEKTTLVQKLISIYETIDHIDKRGRNSSPGQGNYAYVKATDLAHAVRKALLELKIYAEVNFKNERQYTIARAEGKSPFAANDVTCTIVFRDGESGDTITSSGLGTGTDMSDKAIYKAQTGALKYALRNAFLVPDEADPEATTDESESGHVRPEPPAKSTARPNNPPAKQAELPKAEIPNDSEPNQQNGSSSQSNSELPSSEELDGFRNRFGKLIDALSTAGLKPGKGLPIQKKVLIYLLQETGATAAEKITRGAWTDFFENSGQISVGEGGFRKLVELVNSAIEGKQ